MTCDCPACEPQCRRTGRRCFIVCERCKGELEEDAIGALTSRTVNFVKPPTKPPRMKPLTQWYSGYDPITEATDVFVDPLVPSVPSIGSILVGQRIDEIAKSEAAIHDRRMERIAEALAKAFGFPTA